MTRDDIIRMAREAGFEVHERKQQARVGMDALVGVDSTEKLQRFATLVAAHTISHFPPPAIMVDAKSLDPELLKGMLEKASPMPIVAMPPSDEVAAAVAAEREACAKVCDAKAADYQERAAKPEDQRDIAPGVARIAFLTCGQNAAAIRARGTP